MKKIFLLFEILIGFVVLLSCGGGTNFDETNTFSRQITVYKNRLFYFDNLSVKYKNLDDTSRESAFLCSDSLCSHDNSSCPLFLGKELYIMAVDEQESAENGGYPVLYISSDWAEYKSELGRWDGDGYRIIRYDGAKNTSKVIVSKIADGINNFFLYKNYIFYTAGNGEFLNIYAVTKDGKNKYMLENTEKATYVIIGIENDVIYYADWVGNIYKSDLQLKTKEFVIKTQSSMGCAYIYNGYLYYADDCKIAGTAGDTEIQSCSLCRVALDNLSKPEILSENIFFGPYIFKAGNKIYYCRIKIEYVGEGLIENFNNTDKIDVYYDGTGDIFSYDMETGETRLEAENKKSNLGIFYGGTKDYIIYSIYEPQTDLTKSYEFKVDLFSLNLKTHEQIKIIGVK